MADTAGLLIKVRGDGTGSRTGERSLGLKAGSMERILELPPASGGAMGADAEDGATWLRAEARTRDADNPWDDAHALLERGAGFSADGGPPILAVEPDLAQRWDFHEGETEHGMAAGAHPVCAYDPPSVKGGVPPAPEIVAWNAGPDFTQLAAARKKVGAKQAGILLAHLDTGIDPKHLTCPAGLVDKTLWRNFVRDGHGPNDAVDHAPAGTLTANRGHGTATLGLAAGNRLDGTSPGWEGFTDYVGGAPLVRVLPVRVANWVVRFSTSTLVQGFDYARQQGAHVLTMSMGGLSSAALVDAVNLAYEHGVFMVTAGGNNIAAVLSPKSIVFPARYQRVVAACGVMSDGRAYAGLHPGTMQGNYGPDAKMETALGAYTPNVPWAEIDCGKVVDMDGAGTSAATPQVAAAAALWLAEHWNVVKAYPQPWMRVEAVRAALFASARKSTALMDRKETFRKIGQGVVQAAAALGIAPPPPARLKKLPPATESWSWLNLLLGGGVSLAPGGPAALQRQRMLALELTQMAQRVAEIDAAIADPGADPAEIPPVARNRYLEAALDAGTPSKPLRAVLEAALGRRASPAAPLPSVPAPAPVRRQPRTPPPPQRRLRVYALDPSVGKALASVAIHQATLPLPWDDSAEAPLLPGPVGEYIEVVDVDPASDRAYDPVDLNDKTLLAQDGLAPSEGNPQFHQQMVYAVAMTTIGHFERALGRRALWAPRYASHTGRDGEPKLRGYEVPRLRIYPHALRTQNAYYSPDRKALLFGYFPADSRPGDVTAGGSMVFSCLSSDIIAHETSHALLDGLHRRFQEASNPDVPAFHEGFADIVALFQHFTMRELVSFEIARAHGNLSAVNLLSGLARQFGEGSGRAGPLRDYGEPAMAALDYDTTLQPHARGSILVFAVYDAFQAIVAQRTQHLIQLATGGSGVLPAGALHPGLVERLTDDIVETARQMLDMCIRALDYCPAVDITFGEYLRALVTADLDAYPEDTRNYRLAFMEAFRKWKLLPRGVRTISQETLAWDTPAGLPTAWLVKVLGKIDLGWDRQLTRSRIFDLNEANRWTLWAGLKEALAADDGLYAQLGLLPGLGRFRNDGTLSRKADEGGSTFDVYGVRPTRRVEPDGSCRTEVVAVVQQRIPVRLDGTAAPDGVERGEPFFWFRGGATVIIDPRKDQEAIRYAIIKSTGSKERRRRQAQTAAAHFMSPLRALYFGQAVREPFALLHCDHGGEDHG